MRVALQHGRLELSSLKATLPGVELSGSGHGTRNSLQGTLHLEVHRLAALVHAFGDVLKLPPLAGHGSLQLELSGRPAHPGLQAEGHFATLAVGPFSAEGLELAGRLPDVTRPLQSNASVQASALRLAGRSLRDVRATLRTRHGNAYLGQTQLNCRDGGLRSADEGAPIIYRCMTHIGRDLAGWLAGGVRLEPPPADPT